MVERKRRRHRNDDARATGVEMDMGAIMTCLAILAALAGTEIIDHATVGMDVVMLMLMVMVRMRKIAVIMRVDNDSCKACRRSGESRTESRCNGK